MMAEEPAEKPIRFPNHVVKLLEKLETIPKSSREIFLWDLIRLANGAVLNYRLKCLDKGRINNTQEKEDSDFFIKIEADKDNRTLSITHKGIGLERDDLMAGIGCISEDFVNNFLGTIDKYLMNGDPNAYYSADELDTRFSLGFYSAFMVADRVVITTKEVVPDMERVHALKSGNYPRPGDQYVWDASASDGFFRIYRDDPVAKEDRLKRGTKVTLYLKNEYLTYLDKTKLRDLVDKYTFDDCPYPIYVSADHDHERGKKRRHTAGSREENLECLKKEFEGLRELCVQALRTAGVENVVVDDRVFDLPGYGSNDGKTFVINPRSPIMKSLLVKFKENPVTHMEDLMIIFSVNLKMYTPSTRLVDHYKSKLRSTSLVDHYNSKLTTTTTTITRGKKRGYDDDVACGVPGGNCSPVKFREEIAGQ